MQRTSHRVKFPGGLGFDLAGIVDAASNAQAVAVFSHCFTCNKDLKSIVRISRSLAVHGVTVLRFDMTGLGSSDGDFSQTNFSSNLKDLGAAIRFAMNEIGDVTGLIGHSFGGAASLAIAASESESFPTIRCVATLAAPSDTSHLATLLSRMNPAIESEGFGDVTIGGLHWTIRRQMLEDFRQHDLPGLLAKLRLPVLLLQSPDDMTVGLDHALRIMTLVQSASGGQGSASLLTLPGADHLLTHSPRDVDYVAAAIAAFLKRYRANESA